MRDDDGSPFKSRDTERSLDAHYIIAPQASRYRAKNDEKLFAELPHRQRLLGRRQALQGRRFGHKR